MVAGGQAALPDLRASDRRAVGRADHRSGDGAGRGHALHGAGAGRARAQGRVRQAAGGASQRRLRAREDRRSRAHARGVDRARQALQARHLGGGRPARDAPRRAQAARRLDRDRGGPCGRAGGARDRRRLQAGGRRGGAPGPCDRSQGGARGGDADRTRRDARRGHPVHVLRAFRMPRARAFAGRARAADLLVQLPARRLRPLHGTRLADGDRSGAGRAGPVAVDRRRGARAVGEQQLQLLRAGDRGDRRALRGRPRGSLGGAARGAARPVPRRNQRRAGAGDLPQPLRAPALLRDALRGDRQEPAAPLSRDGLRVDAREDRGIHVAARVSGVRRRAAAGGVARGARRRHADRGLLRAVGATGVGVAGGGRAVGHRQARGAADRARDLRAAAVPGERRHRLPVDGSGGLDAFRRRGAADSPRDADRLLARGCPVHPRRALDRPAPARQFEADRDARAPARSRQHGDRGRARRADDARIGPSRRPRAGRGRTWRSDRRAGHRGAGAAREGVADGTVPGGHTHDRAAGASDASRAATSRSSAPASTTCATSTCTSRSAC